MSDEIPHREYHTTITGTDDIRLLLTVIDEISADFEIVNRHTQNSPDCHRTYRIAASGETDLTVLLDAFDETGADYSLIQQETPQVTTVDLN